jgi:hypothetical protein
MAAPSHPAILGRQIAEQRTEVPVAKLLIEDVPFAEGQLEKWRSPRSVLKRSLFGKCAPPLKELLQRKTKRRPRHFFGETFVATRERPYSAAWYGSYKWLTSPKWTGHHELSDAYQEGFRRALQRHIQNLEELQRLARRNRLGKKLVAPDLFIIEPRKLRFIEVKLPGDRVTDHQLAGLALIQQVLRPRQRIPVTVELMYLHSSERTRDHADVQRRFESISARVGRLVSE